VLSSDKHRRDDESNTRPGSVAGEMSEAHRSEMRGATETMASHYSDVEDASFREIDPWEPEDREECHTGKENDQRDQS